MRDFMWFDSIHAKLWERSNQQVTGSQPQVSHGEGSKEWVKMGCEANVLHLDHFGSVETCYL
jgi:hypothetical protein